ncbi:MAG: hypothetical protein HQ509_02255 [Candidatus Marinimicrobia bacterium]|nr:hypothetical protein [Candidatus Neomarinimicrobiota bacterium]
MNSEANLAKTLKQLIVVRTDVHARQLNNGRYLKVDKPLSLELIQDHLKGSATIGSYPFHKEGSKVKWFCFDLDINKNVSTELSQEKGLSNNQIFEIYKNLLIEQSRLIQDRAKHYGIRLIPEFSGSKGIHLWGFGDGFIEASKIRIVMKGILRDVDLLSEDLHIDLFPMQDSVGDKLGNFVKLPCGIHKKTGHRCSFLRDNYAIQEDSDYSYQNQFDIIIDVLIENKKVEADLIESLQEEFFEDEIPQSEQLEQLELTEDSLNDIEVSGNRVEKIFNNCHAFSNMINIVKETGYLTHGQRLALSFSMVNLGKPGIQKLEDIIGGCKDYKPEITDGFIRNIKKNKYKPFGCKRLLEPNPHHNNEPICPIGGLCENIQAISGRSPNSFAWIPRSKTALKINKDRERLKEQKEKSSQISRITSETNLLLAWHRVKNSLENEVWYDVEEVERYERFLSINLSLLSQRLKFLKGKAIPFSPYDLVKVRKFKNQDPNLDSIRPIAIMNLEDYIVAQAIINVVAPIYDNHDVFHENNFGNRLADQYDTNPRNLLYWDKQWGEYSGKIFQAIRDFPFNQFLKIDLSKYYETIPQDNLISLFGNKEYGIDHEVQIWLNSLVESFQYSHEEKPEGIGIPQGPEFSHILANIYLNQFDQWLSEKYDKSVIVHYRYVDDIYILLNNKLDKKNIKIDAFYNEVGDYLENELGLSINVDKRKIGYNFEDGTDLLHYLNKVKYRVGQEVRNLASNENVFTGEEIQQIEYLIKSMIEFESEADIDEILPHLNFASRAIVRLGVDTTAIKNILVQKLNLWNPSTYNLKFLLKLLLDIYTQNPSEDIETFFTNEIDSYRRLLTQELIREGFKYGLYDANGHLKKLVIQILKTYLEDEHHLVRGSSYVLLEKFDKQIDPDRWVEVIESDSTSEYEKHSLVKHLNAYAPPLYGPYFKKYIEHTPQSIPAGYSAVLDLPNDRNICFSSALRQIPDFINESNPETIWEQGNQQSLIYAIFSHIQFIGHTHTGNKARLYRYLFKILDIIPESVAKTVANAIVLNIPWFVKKGKWNQHYYGSLFDVDQLSNFPTILKEAIHEVLYMTPSNISDKSTSLEKRMALFNREINDEIYLNLLNRVNRGELVEGVFHPGLLALRNIISQEKRWVFRFDDTSDVFSLIYERFPLENITRNSSLQDEDSILSYFHNLQDSGFIPLIDFKISKIFGKSVVSLLYRLDNNFKSLAEFQNPIVETDVINILWIIESALKPFYLVRADNQVNLPHIHPYSVHLNQNTAEIRIVMVGSAFDREVYYIPRPGNDHPYANSFSDSSVYFNLGFLSLELLTYTNPVIAWNEAERNRQKGEGKKYLSHNDALDDASYMYKWWILKDLCNIIPEYRKSYDPAKVLIIDRIKKRYDQTLRAVNDIYETNMNVVHPIDKNIIEYLAYMDMTVKQLADAPNKWSNQPHKVLNDFQNSFLQFISNNSITWNSGKKRFNYDKFTLNYATRFFISFADEIINFLSQAHKVFGHTLHDNWYYPSLLFYQAIKNEIYCLLIAILDDAGLRNPDDLFDNKELKRLLKTQKSGNRIIAEFPEHVLASIQKNFNPNRLINALKLLSSSDKNVFENFHSGSLSTYVDLFIFLSGNIDMIVNTEEEIPFKILKGKAKIDSGKLRSLVGNLQNLENKIDLIRKDPTEVSENDFKYVVKLVELILKVAGEIDPVTLVIGKNRSRHHLAEEKIEIEIPDTDEKVTIAKNNIAFPMGTFELIYEGDIGVGLIGDESRPSYINPSPKYISKILEKLERRQKKAEIATTELATIDSQQSGQTQLEQGNFLSLDVRKKLRSIMGETKIIKQEAEQIINIDGERHTINTGTVQQVIQPSQIPEKTTSAEENKSAITAGEFLLKSDSVDLRINDGEVIECVIKRQYIRNKKKISRPFLFISVIAEDNSETKRRKIAGRTIFKRMKELGEVEKRSITETNVSVYANVFRDQIDKVLRKAGYELNRDSLLPDAKINGGYQLGDGFFITKVEDE